MSLYNPCPCDSGKKFKFCCSEALKKGDSAYLASRVTKFPVLCFAGENYQERGFTDVIVARQIFDDNYIAASYLIDLMCLGVRDTFAVKDYTRAKLEEFVRRHERFERMIPYTYEDARSLILGSVAYAVSFDIAPHGNWASTKFLVEPDRSFENNCTFGLEGKPFYVVGQDDPRQMYRDITNKIRDKGGRWSADLDDISDKALVAARNL